MKGFLNSTIPIDLEIQTLGDDIIVFKSGVPENTISGSMAGISG
jgi:hypothetical protein